MMERVPVLIPQSFQFRFVQFFCYLWRKRIVTYLGAFAQEILDILKTFFLTESMHLCVQGLWSIPAKRIFDEGTSLLIYVNNWLVRRRICKSYLCNVALELVALRLHQRSCGGSNTRFLSATGRTIFAERGGRFRRTQWTSDLC